jgi:hypothetical protein
MDVTLFIAWEWFQWIAIRIALFLGLLTLGPSISLIVLDLLLYAYRTTFDRILVIRTTKKKEVHISSDINKNEIEVREVEVTNVEVKDVVAQAL